jgi:hypothetical protein
MSVAWHKKGDRAAHERARRLVLAANVERTGGVCQAKVPGVCTRGQATEAHHVLGRAVTGDDPRYMIAVCRPCNASIGDPMRVADPPARPVSRW